MERNKNYLLKEREKLVLKILRKYTDLTKHTIRQHPATLKTYGTVFMPVYLDPALIDITKRYTPLTGLMARNIDKKQKVLSPIERIYKKIKNWIINERLKLAYWIGGASIRR